MKKRFAAGLTASVAFMLSPPVARAADFDPCSAVERLRYATGTARHLVFAVSAEYSSNEVVVTECGKQGGSWRAMSVTAGRAAFGGFAGDKREGDGRSPVGSFPVTEAFGVGNPGTRLPYRTLRNSGDCWSATPGRDYNEYYSGQCRQGDENLSAIMQQGPYRQAAVIDYNRPRAVPGRGSAIFLHVGGVTPTTGCISIPEDRLREIMRTLAVGDRVIMGPRPALFGES
jgi:L,D-peptidoglycan transpeptidase YkuD (ErfK/YbiS/YcfS/YnhG family)